MLCRGNPAQVRQCAQIGGSREVCCVRSGSRADQKPGTMLL